MPEHTVLLPVMAAGCAGAAFTPTAKVCAVLLPQAPLATTVMLPPVAPAVALMLTPVDVPVHPPGSVHVYDVAKVTGAML